MDLYKFATSKKNLNRNILKTQLEELYDKAKSKQVLSDDKFDGQINDYFENYFMGKNSSKKFYMFKSNPK